MVLRATPSSTPCGGRQQRPGGRRSTRHPACVANCCGAVWRGTPCVCVATQHSAAPGSPGRPASPGSRSRAAASGWGPPGRRSQPAQPTAPTGPGCLAGCRRRGRVLPAAARLREQGQAHGHWHAAGLLLYMGPPPPNQRATYLLPGPARRCRRCRRRVAVGAAPPPSAAAGALPTCCMCFGQLPAAVPARAGLQGHAAGLLAAGPRAGRAWPPSLLSDALFGVGPVKLQARMEGRRRPKTHARQQGFVAVNSCAAAGTVGIAA